MFVTVYVTVGMEKEAKQIAKALLSKKLIACANLFPVNSLFYWEGKLQEDDEFGLIMKSRLELVDKIIEEVKNIHSYEVPCITVWPISKGNDDYLDWIQEETGGTCK